MEMNAAAEKTAFAVENGGSRAGAPLDVFGTKVWVKIASRDTTGAFVVMEASTPPNSGPPLHLHKEQDEWWYVLEGEFEFEVDGEMIHAGPGSTVFAEHGTRHTFRNIGDMPGRTLVTVFPGGLDEYFEELSELSQLGGLPALPVLARLFEKHGLELLGPPLSARGSGSAGAITGGRKESERHGC